MPIITVMSSTFGILASGSVSCELVFSSNSSVAYVLDYVFMHQRENNRCSGRRISKDRRNGSILGNLALSYSLARTRGLHSRPPFSILGTNHRGPAGRDKMVSRRAPESRLFCGGTHGLNQLSTTRRNPFCVVSRASQQVFLGARGAASRLWSVRPPRTEAPARPFQSCGRCRQSMRSGLGPGRLATAE